VSQFLTDIFGLPAQSQIGLRTTRWLDDLLPTPGATGVPDLLTQPQQCMSYLNGVRDIITQAGKQKPLIRLADSNLEIMQELDGELSCSMEEIVADTGKVVLKIHYDNWLTDYMIHQTMGVTDLHLLIDPIPTQQNWRYRWGGKITEIHIRKTERGEHEIELTALSFYEHAKRLLVAANPLFPPEIQLPRMWVLPGPVRSIIAATMFVNLARLFMPGWSTIASGLNPAGWINPLNPDAVLNVLPTEWPIQVAFVDPVFDQSRWSAVGATWTSTWHDAFKDLLVDAGCMMRWYTYLTTDEDSPNIELANLLTLAPELLSSLLGVDLSQLTQTVEKLVAPQRNCAIVSLVDVSGQTGPTGTAADGLINTVAVTLDDLITPVSINLATGQTYDPGQVLNGEPVLSASGIDQTYLIEQLFNVAPSVPNIIWWDGYFNGIIDTDLTWRKGAVKTIMTGSKSPTIVNEAQTFMIRYALAQLSDVINQGIADNFGAPLQNTPAVGLDNLYQGQLDNTLLAWERYTDPIRALYAGDLAWQEHFEKGSGTAYTLASVLTLRSGDWKTRDWAAFKATPEDGRPWIALLDYDLGDRVGFENDGVIYVDNVTSIKREWDWGKPVKVTIKIGEDKEKGDPFNSAFKTMAGLYNLIGELAGEGTLFG
jgi:hypothetical protein